MSLLSIIEEIKKATQYAQENVDSGSSSTLNARRGRKAQSIEKLKQLKTEYVREVLKSVVFIVATGSEKDTLAMIGSEKFGCFNADPEQVFDELADNVAPVLYLNKDSTVSLFETVGRHLEDKALNIGMIGYNQLLFKQQYRRNLKTKEDFQALIKKAINEQVGAELIGIQAVYSILDQAIANEFTGTIVPIILSTDDESLITSLQKDLLRLTKNVFVVAVGKTTKTVKALKNVQTSKSLNEEKVKELLLEIKKSVVVK